MCGRGSDGWSCCQIDSIIDAVYATMGEVQHSHSKTDTAYQLHSPICFLNGVPCDFRMIEEYGEGLGGWSCCQVDSSSGAISPNSWIRMETIAKATGDGPNLMAAQMVRAQRTMG